MQFQWLLCGHSTRWYHAACRFGPQSLPRKGDRLAITVVAPAQLRHACRQSEGSVVLWPLDASPAPPSLQVSVAALAQLADVEVPALHLIVPPNAPSRFLAAGESHSGASGSDGGSTEGGSASLALDLLELGGSAILVDGPEELSRLAPLLRRFWERIRPRDEPLDALSLPLEPSA